MPSLVQAHPRDASGPEVVHYVPAHAPAAKDAPSQATRRIPLRQEERRSDPVATRRRLASMVARWIAAAWWGLLFGTLLGLGRVPWPEALAWSCVSSLVLWRTVVASLRSILDHLLGETRIELGMQHPQDRRKDIRKALLRRGYRQHRHQIGLDVFRARRAGNLFPPVRIAWSGPGAVVEGPRLLVRKVVRIAVG